MSQTRTIWVPTPEDRTHIDALRDALCGEGHVVLSDASIISHALRETVGSLRLRGNAAGVDMRDPTIPTATAGETASVEVDPSLPLIAHTDGACSGNPGPGGWAVVFSQGGKEVAEHSGGSLATTNNRMELTAVREALKRAPEGIAMEVVTDSQNVIGWLSKGWKRNDPLIAAICRKIDRLLAARKVTFRWVKGHDGDPLNERVDRLAVAAIGGS
jgi:ribonuclease HI